MIPRSPNPEQPRPDEGTLEIERVEQLRDSQAARLWGMFQQGRSQIKRLSETQIGRRAMIAGTGIGAAALTIGVDRLMTSQGKSSTEQVPPFILDEKNLEVVGFQRYDTPQDFSSTTLDISQGTIRPHAETLTLTQLSPVMPSKNFQTSVNFITAELQDRDPKTHLPKAKLMEGVNIISFTDNLPVRKDPYAIALPDNMQDDNLQLYVMRVGKHPTMISAFTQFSDLQIYPVEGKLVADVKTKQGQEIKVYSDSPVAAEGQLILVFGRKH